MGTPLNLAAFRPKVKTRAEKLREVTQQAQAKARQAKARKEHAHEPQPLTPYERFADLNRGQRPQILKWSAEHDCWLARCYGHFFIRVVPNGAVMSRYVYEVCEDTNPFPGRFYGELSAPILRTLSPKSILFRSKEKQLDALIAYLSQL